MRASAPAKTPSKRLYILAAVLFLWVAAVLGRLVYLQVIKYQFFLNLASRQHGRTIDVDPRRGTIYDRNGAELAMSIDVDSVFAVPSEIPDQETTAQILAKVLDLDAQELLARLALAEELCLGEAQARCRDQRSRPRPEPARHLLPQGTQALLSQARSGGPSHWLRGSGR